MIFAAPELLFALLVVPVAALGYQVLERRRAKRSVAWSTSAMMPNIVRRPPRRLRYVPVALFLLGLTFLLVGFARPQRILTSVTNTHGGGTTIVLTMDTSGSMAAGDVPPTRMVAAHDVAVQFLKQLPAKYRVALVTFGNEVHVPVPPTFDRKKLIAEIPITVTPKAGTSIGDAISQSIAVVVQGFGPSQPGVRYRPGAVLLISDGSQTAGGTSPEHAALFARADGIPINTVAVGTPNGAVTQTVKIGNYQASTRIPVPVDPSTLSDVSRLTKGTFFTGASAFKAGSVKQVTRITKSLGTNSVPGHRRHDLSAAAGELALLFILAGIVVSGLWFGRVA